MKPVKNWLVLFTLLVSLLPMIASADVLLEDFADKFGDSPIQGHLGAAAGYSLHGESNVALGGGEWFAFNDINGSQVSNNGLVLDDANLDLAMSDSVMTVNLKTTGSTEQYPYAGVGCTILGDKDSYVDLSKMSAIQLKIKGSGSVTLEMVTEDIDTLTVGNDWGFYHKDIALTSDWNTVTISVNELAPAQWSHAAGEGWSWGHGKMAVQAIQFLVTENADVDLAVDSIVFVGIDYMDLGFIYKDQNTPTSGPFDIKVNKLAVLEKSVGYEISPVTVYNYDTAQTHTIAVDDARFEVVNGVLKLKDSEQLHHANGSSIPVTVTATDANGDVYSEQYTISVKAILEGDVIKWGGARSSVYGANPFPNPADFNQFIHRVSNDFPDAEPATIWIVGTIDSWGNCQLEFPSDGNSYSYVGFGYYDKHEEHLTEFDRTDTKVYLQVEGGLANNEDLIRIIMNRYGHHPSVAGFAVDVEWYESVGETNTTIAVTDSAAEAWDVLTKSYNPEYQLVLKHWLPSVMPETYRSDIIFLDDSQAFPNLEAMCAEFKVWADLYSDNPVMFQIGYDHLIDGNNDYSWWSLLANPVKEMGNAIKNTVDNPWQKMGIVWVDFTMHYPEIEAPVVPDTFYLKAKPTIGGTVNGSGNYEEGEYATVTATPDSGYRFAYWFNDSGSVTITDTLSATTTVRVTGDAVIAAMFKEIEPVLQEMVTETILTKRDTTVTVDTTVTPALDTFAITTTLEEVVTTTITQTDSLRDQVIFWTDIDTAVNAYTNTIAVDTTLIGESLLQEMVTETILTEKDTTVTVDTTVSPALDTFAITTTLEEVVTTTITQTDSLRDQVIFWTDIDTAVNAYTNTISVDTTLIGEPLLQEMVTETILTEKDTTVTADSTVTGELDTIVITTTLEDVVTTTITQTDSLRNRVIFWTDIDTTVNSYTNTIAVDTVILQNQVVTPVYTLAVVGTNGSVTGAGDYDSASVVAITATPDAGYKFVSWSVSGNATIADDASANSSVTIEGNATVTAIFEVTGGSCEYEDYKSSAVYTGGDIVSYNGNHWKAKWWTQGVAPYESAWGVWKKLDSCNH